MDANLKRLGAVVGLSVKDRDLTTPPASPPTATATSFLLLPRAWAGKTNQIAVRIADAWEYHRPRSAGFATSRTRPSSRLQVHRLERRPRHLISHLRTHLKPAPRLGGFAFLETAMTEPEQQPPRSSRTCFLRREDFDELLDRAAERGAERVPTHSAWKRPRREGHPRTARPAGSVARCPPYGVADHHQGHDHRHPGCAAGGAAIKLKLMGGVQ